MSGEKNKKTVEAVVGIIVIVIFFISNIPGILEYFITDNVGKEEIMIFIRIVSIICYCTILIPIMFSIFKLKDLSKCYYYVLPFVYILLPIVLLLNINILDKSLIALVLLIVSIIMALFIYKILKQGKGLDLEYLKFSSFVMSALFAITSTLLEIIFCKINMKLLLFCGSLLLLLEIVYKKLELDRKERKCEEHATIPGTEPPAVIGITTEKPIESSKQGNPTASGTVSVNLEVKI